MWMTDIQRVARKMGVELVFVRPPNLEKYDGIMAVDNFSKGWRRMSGDKDAGHVVVVYEGLIFDSCGPMASTPAQYKRCNKSKFLSMLVKVKN